MLQSPPARPGPSPLPINRSTATNGGGGSGGLQPPAPNHFMSGSPSFALPSSSNPHGPGGASGGAQPTSIPIGFATSSSANGPRSPPTSHRGSFSGSYGASLARSFRLGSFGQSNPHNLSPHQGSYTGFGGGFGPMGSYDEKMVRMGSWKGRFVGAENGLPWQAGGVDNTDFSMAMSTSLESLHGSFGGAMKMARREQDFCQNYNCCGLQLNSMHDLLEHYEDVHGTLPASPPVTPSGGSNDIDSMDLESDPSWDDSGYKAGGSGNGPSPLGISTGGGGKPTPGAGGGGRLTPSAIPPTLLFAGSGPTLPLTPGGSPSVASAVASIPTAATGGGTIIPHLAHPGGVPPPPGTNQKLFHCPTPGCNKSYKQQNGLKYHLKVGQCNFDIRDAVENGLSEAEAEEKSRPYVCQVGGGCTKRYRQMNGLRYHYLNSGAHGAIGLALIQQGKHASPKGVGSHGSHGSNSTAAAAQQAAAHQAQQQAQAAAQRAAAGGQSGAGLNGGSGGGGGNGHGGPSPLLSAVSGKSGIWTGTGSGGATTLGPAADTKDEVLFTVNEDDVDMDL